MIIQCPECNSRYRTKELPQGQASMQVKCPKCSHQFAVTVQPPRPTILVVDDARFFRELLLDLLQERAAKLLTADSADEALEVLQRQTVNLLLIDINLPDKNGLELIRELRSDSRFEQLPILCISGVYRKEDDAKKAIRAGADDFISKSFKPDELNARIDKLLGR